MRRHPKQGGCEWRVAADLLVEIVVVVSMAAAVRRGYVAELDPGPTFGGCEISASEDAADDFGVW